MYLISYDITSNKIRRKVSDELESFGKRVQYSVFEAHITKKQFKTLYARLLSLMEHEEEGNIRIYSLCDSCSRKANIIGTPADNINFEKDVIII